MVIAPLGACPYGSVAILGRVDLCKDLYSTWVTIVSARLVAWWSGNGVIPGVRDVGLSYKTTSLGIEPSVVRVSATVLSP